MADFVEVMRQARRMCESYGNGVDKCENCPMYNHCGQTFGCNVTDVSLNCDAVRYVEFESIVMTWAEKHPELRYPTWLKYLTTIGVLPEKLPYPSSYKDMMKALLVPLDETEIPANIAEKLGIKPIEGGK